jgi:hypothetical protein
MNNELIKRTLLFRDICNVYVDVITVIYSKNRSIKLMTPFKVRNERKLENRLHNAFFCL